MIPIVENEMGSRKRLLASLKGRLMQIDTPVILLSDSRRRPNQKTADISSEIENLLASPIRITEMRVEMIVL